MECCLLSGDIQQSPKNYLRILRFNVLAVLLYGSESRRINESAMYIYRVSYIRSILKNMRKQITKRIQKEDNGLGISEEVLTPTLHVCHLTGISVDNEDLFEGFISISTVYRADLI